MSATAALPAPPALVQHRSDQSLTAVLNARSYLLFLAAHVVLGAIVFRFPILSVAHALATLSAGLWFASKRRYVFVAGVAAAYVAGAEVLWRMTRPVSWEFGKYAIIAILLTALFKMRHRKRHNRALLFFVLMLPSAVLTLSELPLSDARQYLAFNLSGPLALAVAFSFFHNVKMSRKDFAGVFAVLSGPVAGIVAFSLLHMSQLHRIRFSAESNFDTSGGFGPNQVSAILGLAALSCFLASLFLDEKAKRLRILMFVAMSVFAAQSALTFSRGGLYCAAGAGAAAAAFLIRKPKIRKRLVTIGLVAVAGFALLILPRLQQFTGGTLLSRFQTVDLTHRDTLLRDELRAFLANPILGVGPGMIYFKREIALLAPAHTEFSRAVSEHGLFGVTALGVLFLICATRYSKGRGREERAIIVALTVWAVLYMLINAMRLAAPALILGLSAASLRGMSVWTLVPVLSSHRQKL